MSPSARFLVFRARYFWLWTTWGADDRCTSTKVTPVQTARARAQSAYTRDAEQRQPPRPPPNPPQLLSIRGGPSLSTETTNIHENHSTSPPRRASTAALSAESSC